MSRLIKIADWSGEKRGNVIFVHGLGGHPYTTWRRKSDDDTYWPLWLAEDVNGLAVFSLGYISPPTNWLGTAMPLLDESANILRLLLQEPALRTGPVSFICHSLGGLIVKQVLRSAKEQRSDPIIADFFDRIRQVIFIATPHTGSGKATLVEFAGFLAWGSASAQDLVANKPELRDLNIGYRGLAEERRGSLHHLVYYEMVDTLFGRIVAPNSADPGLPNCKPVPIREDHVAICKPRFRHELIYAETRDFVAQLSYSSRTDGNLQTYKLEPFIVEWSWKSLLPKLLRLSVLILVVVGVSGGIEKLAELHRSIKATEQNVGQLRVQLEGLSKQLSSMSAAASTPDADKAIRNAVQSAVDGATAGDQQFVAALTLLREGKTEAAERLFRVVAEQKAVQTRADSNAAAAAYRNLGAIAGLSDPKRSQEAYGQALGFNPDDMESLYWFGWLNQLAGNLTVADQSLNRLLRVASTAGDERGVYRANLRLGEINMERGDLTLALEFQNKAMTVAATQAKANATGLEWQRDLSISYEKIGEVYQAQGKLSGALESYKAAFTIAEQLAKADRENAAWQRDLSVAFNLVGDVYVAQGDLPGALQSYKASLTIRERLSEANAKNAAWQRDLSISYEKIGNVMQVQHNLSGAMESYKASLTIRERLAKDFPENAGWQRDISVSHEKIGDVLQGQRDLPAALEQYKSALAIRERLAKADSANTTWQRDLSVSYNKIGAVYQARGDFSAALDSFKTSLAIRARLAKADPGNAAWQADLGLSYALLGQLYRGLGDDVEALHQFKSAREVLAPLAVSSGNQVWQGYIRNIDAEIVSITK